MKKTTKVLAGLAVLVVLAAMLAACGSGGSTSNPLAGTKWNMQDYAGETGMTTVLLGETPAIEFGKDDKVSGTGGCNDYTGTYSVDGEALTFGPLAGTMKACSEPEGVMEQETAFMGLLQSAAGYKLDGGQLHILNDKGHLVILLNRQ
jgi:heat shock protein HslJ